MWVALGLLLPIAAFTGVCATERNFVRRLSRYGWLPRGAAAVAAVVVFATMASLIAGGNHWPRTTQIAWTGVDRLPGRRANLTIGGSEQDAIVGWPNGGFAPMVRVTPAGGNTLQLTIGRGGGFVRLPATGEFLNGLWLPEDYAYVVDGYRFVLTPKYWPLYVWPFPYDLSVYRPDGKLVADVTITRPRPFAGESYISLEYLNTRSSKDVPHDAIYERWARPILLAVTRKGIRILDRNSVSTHTCEAPCTFTVRWRSGPSVTALASLDADGTIHLHYRRPWRRVSPLPEKSAGGRRIVVTRDAQPGDYAFVLPFGGGYTDPRATVRLDADEGVPRFAGAGASEQQRAADSDGGVVTSTTSVRSGEYAFNFATAIDVLHPGVVVLRLLLALALLITGLVFFGARAERRDQWLISGIALVLFALLSFRVALAVRYAAAPEFLDRIAIKGVVLSLVAVTALPSLLLLEARLRDDLGRLAIKRGGAERAVRWAAVYGAAITVAVLVQLNVAGAIWPAIPEALVPGRSLAITVFIVLAAFDVHLAFLIWRAYRSHLRASLTYEKFAESTASFWKTVANAPRPTRLSEWKWYGAVVLLALAVVIAIFIVRLIPGQRAVQEIVAPLILTLLPALLWLAAGAHIRPPKNIRRQQWMPSFSLLFWAMLTVLVPAVVFPAAIGDPGSILATASVFVPVALVLGVSDHAKRAGAAVGVALAVAGLVALMLYLRSDSTTKLPGTGNVQTRLLVFRRDAGIQKNILLESQDLEDAALHTWQNKAIAHEGSWFGRGYGNAPTRRSQVAQDTLQFDSVFSFFIFSEHGLVGAVALILLYSAPLVLFLLTRAEASLATVLGLVIASAFFGEAWFHAAMNIGAWPFAGRNLPLLSVNSGTDVVKWLLLFVIATAAQFWRAEVPHQVAQGRGPAETVVSRPTYRWLGATFAAVAALLVGVIAYRGARNVTDPHLGEPFTWDAILASVQRFTADGTLTLDRNNNVVPRNGVALNDSLLARQIEAFNQLPLDEKTGEAPHPQLAGRIFSATDALSYEQALRDEATHGDDVRARPPLLRLTPLPQYADEEGFVPVVGPRYAIRANPEFNMRVSFHELQTRDSIPRIVLSEQQVGTYVLQGGAFAIAIPRRFHQPYETRKILLSPDGNEVGVTSDTAPAISRGEVTLRVRGTHGWMLHPFVRFEVTEDGLLYLDNHPRGFRLVLRRADRDLRVIPGQRVQLLAGDRVDLAFHIGVDPSFIVGENDPAPVVGPAWVMGRWLPAYDRRSPLPWTPHLARVLEGEWERLGPAAASEKYKTLTFDPALQQAAQDLAAVHGRQLHDTKLAALAWRRSASRGRVSAAVLKAMTADSQPPRVAVAAISLPTGEVIAMAGWPRMNPGRIGGPCTVADSWCPPSGWIDETAPSFVRARYGGDRNFDRIEMGSSTKPLFAAAALSVHPGLDAQLHVTGPAGVESEVFGIPIPGKSGWKILHSSAGWVDFAHYLAISDNRYQVRLGFLALAEAPHAGVEADGGASPSTLESMNGVAAWHRYPLFPAAMQFSFRHPESMQRIDDSPFAQELRAMYGISIREGEKRTRRGSFWSGSTADDEILPIDPNAPAGAVKKDDHPFDAISPEVANLAFDFVSAPRAYVSLLLGGNENRWANVDFAGAFATAVTGNPVVPHVLKLATPVEVPPERRRFSNIAAHLRPGLEQVVTAGTAAFAKHLLLPVAISRIPGVRVYAKTGTLAVGEGSKTTSRLVIAYIRWADESKGVVSKGIVLSLVAQEAQQGNATEWLGEYINANQERIAGYLR